MAEPDVGMALATVYGRVTDVEWDDEMHIGVLTGRFPLEPEDRDFLGAASDRIPVIR